MNTSALQGMVRGLAATLAIAALICPAETMLIRLPKEANLSA